ncbi:Fungal Zn(2)-Cys(6) binuclear cluster domain-containing protein [Penicillium ucsense]|uniref:Fungal Zn(2)-Cys(6) binuclear cluster domain-containing protein n=1 Tax=Penicillium ucsense TaxID=2839758 RepID=A0A8J8W4N4_9EURO|nr:Fungal Zn(2)-Cys(6) binuclear cluster domain-containing protein [Penicillium ucsense]KAF7739001.1 Fungal Zn(2)-Cys(6) binuclear cluster domain-containing protein [Penicillium ucsense]
MIGFSPSGASFMGEETAASNMWQERKRHRVRHRKSRLGCFPCKSRRVKCDESRPVCGSCSSRGEPCSFPEPPATSDRTRRKPQRSQHRCAGSPHTNDPQPFLKPLGIYASSSASIPTPVNGHSLNMGDLLSMQFFHLYTAQMMSFHPKRSMVWRRVIPDLAASHPYLMHLLLALGGVHMITEKNTQRVEGRDAIDLLAVMDHHQQGLKGFREEVVRISNANAEAVYAGSLLLVAFVYASLQVPQLNPCATPLDQQSLEPICKLNLSWLHLVRGVPTVIQDQWPVLKAGRMRPMVLHFHGRDYWDDLPFVSSFSNLSHCSPRFVLFGQGACQAIVDVKAFCDVLQPPDSNGLGSTPGISPVSSDSATYAPSGAIDVLGTVYSRVLAVLKCSVNEQGSPDDSNILANLEEATVLSWPSLVSDAFITLLDVDDPMDLGRGLSLVMLAHFYVINTLMNRWFLASFKEEVIKIQTLVSRLQNAQLSQLMMWPVKIATT